MPDLASLCEPSGRFLAARPHYHDSDLVIFGAPMDNTVSFRPGARGGPAAIRSASPVLEEYSLYSQRNLLEAAFFDAGDLSLPFGNVERSLKQIEKATAIICDDGKIPLLLGGEHLVTLGALRALAPRHPNLAVIQLDAHADLRADYLGEALSHASVMYHAKTELELEIFQFGIRSATAEEVDFAKQNTHFHPFHVLAPLRECLSLLGGRPVYITLDIDVCDPAFAPGTGTPEPGGITSSELLAVIPLLSGLNMVGADLVEVSPAHDPAGITAVLAAKAVREIILTFTGNKTTMPTKNK